MKQNIKCYKCKKMKSKSEFNKDRTSLRGYYGYCKKCKSELAKEEKRWRNPNYKLRIKQQRRENKMAAVKYKGGKCLDCGYEGYPVAFDFHHPNYKKDNLSNMLKISFNEKAKKELDKCILLCKNCHAIRHFNANKTSNHKGLNQWK